MTYNPNQRDFQQGNKQGQQDQQQKRPQPVGPGQHDRSNKNKPDDKSGIGRDERE